LHAKSKASCWIFSSACCRSITRFIAEEFFSRFQDRTR
jgi:hypothetical protein